MIKLTKDRILVKLPRYDIKKNLGEMTKDFDSGVVIDIGSDCKGISIGDVIRFSKYTYFDNGYAVVNMRKVLCVD